MKAPSILLLLFVITTQVRAASVNFTFIENPVTNPFGSALLGSTGLGAWPRQGQTFMVSQESTLFYAEFYLTGGIPGDPSRYHATLFGNDLVLPLASTTGFVDSPDLANYKRFTFQPVDIAPGEYAIVLNVDERLPNVNIGYGFDGNNYAGGSRISSTDGGATWSHSNSFDSAFRIAFAPVPEPDVPGFVALSVLLFGSFRARRRATIQC